MIRRIEIKHMQTDEVVFEFGKVPEMIIVMLEGKLVQVNFYCE